MINSSTNNTSDWLERLKHPERKEPTRQRITRNLFIRNILNALFIIVALVAMIGIIVAKEHVMVWYSVGLFAVIIKMVEVMLRMPGIKK